MENFISCYFVFMYSSTVSVIFVAHLKPVKSWFICYALGMQRLAKHVPDLQSQAGRAEQVTDTQHATGDHMGVEA